MFADDTNIITNSGSRSPADLEQDRGTHELFSVKYLFGEANIT